MPKTTWKDLLTRSSDGHLLVASLPDSSNEEKLLSARAAQQLLERLFKKLPMRGDYAVTVSRSYGQREIVCAFGSAADAREAVRATEASSAAPRQGWASQAHFLLDETAEARITKIAGPPTTRRTPGFGRP
jgi:hypothetical protein